MKRTLVLAFSSLILQAAVCQAQQPMWPTPPMPSALPSPSIIDQEPATTPLSAWFGSAFGSGASCPHERFWADTEFLSWWTKRVPVTAPLLTAALNPADPTSGFIGSSNTAVLLGGQTYDMGGPRFGGRLSAGGWIDSEQIVGFEGNYLYISPRTSSMSYGSSGAPGSPALAIPFRDATTSQESGLIFTTPGRFGGSSTLQLSNQLQGAEANFAVRLIQTPSLTIVGLAGFRWIDFREQLDFQQGNFGVPGGVAAGQIFNSVDSLHATNDFYGGQLGLRGEYRLGNFFVEGTGKVALGSTQQVMDVAGVTNATFANGNTLTNVPGGTFALSTNSGHFTHNAFCVVPEADLKFGYNVTRSIQLFAGYNFLYLSDVERPGTGIDHTINTTQSPPFGGNAGTLVGPTAPTFSFSRSDFWAQGVNVGIQFKF